MKTILKAKTGDILNGGIINGNTGTITIEREDDEGYRINCDFSHPPHSVLPVQMLIGCPRPPTARRLLKDLTSWGIGKISMLGTDLNEKSYLDSSLWHNNHYMKWVLEGAQQSGISLVPEIDKLYSLKKALDKLPEKSHRFAFDNVNNRGSVNNMNRTGEEEMIIAIGPERGWSDHERELLEQYGFQIHSLGNRILRTETACSAALAIMLNRSGLI